MNPVKLPTKVLDEICKETNKRYVVQSGYERDSYVTRYSSDDHYQAEIYYRALLTHSGYKKRIVDTVEGTVIERYLS